MDAERFTRDWIAAWNRRDLETVVALYATDVHFLSPRAADVTGSAEVHGRQALHSYWAAALARVQHLQFVLDHYVAADDELVILYTAERDGQQRRAAEFFRFGPDGLAWYGEAMYGVYR